MLQINLQSNYSNCIAFVTIFIHDFLKHTKQCDSHSVQQKNERLKLIMHYLHVGIRIFYYSE